MTGNSASEREPIHWQVVALPANPEGDDHWITMTCRPASYDAEVRLGHSAAGRLFVTGLRLGAPDGADPYEIKNLRDILLGDILGAIREGIVSNDPMWTAPVTASGLTRAQMILGSSRPASVTIHRGPKSDHETDLRTREIYEAKLAAGASKTEAAVETAGEVGRDQSTIYRRLARTRRKETP